MGPKRSSKAKSSGTTSTSISSTTIQSKSKAKSSLSTQSAATTAKRKTSKSYSTPVEGNVSDPSESEPRHVSVQSKAPTRRTRSTRLEEPALANGSTITTEKPKRTSSKKTAQPKKSTTALRSNARPIDTIEDDEAARDTDQDNEDLENGHAADVLNTTIEEDDGFVFVRKSGSVQLSLVSSQPTKPLARKVGARKTRSLQSVEIEPETLRPNKKRAAGELSKKSTQARKKAKLSTEDETEDDSTPNDIPNGRAKPTRKMRSLATKTSQQTAPEFTESEMAPEEIPPTKRTKTTRAATKPRARANPSEEAQIINVYENQEGPKTPEPPESVEISDDSFMQQEDEEEALPVSASQPAKKKRKRKSILMKRTTGKKRPPAKKQHSIEMLEPTLQRQKKTVSKPLQPVQEQELVTIDSDDENPEKAAPSSSISGFEFSGSSRSLRKTTLRSHSRENGSNEGQSQTNNKPTDAVTTNGSRIPQSTGDALESNNALKDAVANVPSSTDHESNPLSRQHSLQHQTEANTTPPRPTSAHTVQREGPGTTTQVSLPLSDTPIIRKNQEMRRRVSSTRRSSLGNRGKRASSIGNGFQTVPHSEVEAENFYKHLDPDAPEPHRMKQLLLWTSRRILDQESERYNQMKVNPSLSTDERTAVRIARVIQEEVVQDLSEGKISTSWWNRQEEEDDEGSQKTKAPTNPANLKPNALNISNQQNLAAYQKKLEELRREKAMWMAQLDKSKAAAEGMKRVTALTQATSETTADESLMQALRRYSPGELESVRARYPQLLQDGVGSSDAQAQATVAKVRESVDSMAAEVDRFTDFAQQVRAVAAAAAAFSRGTIRQISEQLQREAESIQHEKKQRLQKLDGATTDARAAARKKRQSNGSDEYELSDESTSSTSDNEDDEDDTMFKNAVATPETIVSRHLNKSKLASVLIKSLQTKSLLQRHSSSNDSNDDTTNDDIDDPLAAIQANELPMRNVLRTITRLEHITESP